MKLVLVLVAVLWTECSGMTDLGSCTTVTDQQVCGDVTVDPNGCSASVGWGDIYFSWNCNGEDLRCHRRCSDRLEQPGDCVGIETRCNLHDSHGVCEEFEGDCGFGSRNVTWDCGQLGLVGCPELCCCTGCAPTDSPIPPAQVCDDFYDELACGGCVSDADCGDRHVCSSNLCECAPDTMGSSCAENWALPSKGTTCTQSSVAYGGVCSRAMDGNLVAEGWIPNQGAGMWIELTFTESITVQHIKLIPHCKNGRQMSSVTVTLKPSNEILQYDGLQCYTGTNGDCSTYGHHNIAVQATNTATSIRIKIETTCGWWDHLGFNEIQVYGISSE